MFSLKNLFALYLFFELVALGFNFHLAGSIPVFLFPFTAPPGTDAVLALNLALELPLLGFGFHLARPIPVLFFVIPLPPTPLTGLLLPVVTKHRRGDPDAEYNHCSQDSPGSHGYHPTGRSHQN